jgi:hypothetical protein
MRAKFSNFLSTPRGKTFASVVAIVLVLASYYGSQLTDSAARALMRPTPGMTTPTPKPPRTTPTGIVTTPTLTPSPTLPTTATPDPTGTVFPPWLDTAP